MSQPTNRRPRSGERVIGAVRRVMNRLRWVLVVMLVVFVLNAALFAAIEPDRDFGDGLWWAVVTFFTVGYGDLYPATVPGRILGGIFIASSAVLWLITGAHIVALILEAKNVYSHAEQERNVAAMLAILKKLQIVGPDQHELPDLEWWVRHHDFDPSAEAEDADPELSDAEFREALEAEQEQQQRQP